MNVSLGLLQIAGSGCVHSLFISVREGGLESGYQQF